MCADASIKNNWLMMIIHVYEFIRFTITPRKTPSSINNLSNTSREQNDNQHYKCINYIMHSSFIHFYVSRANNFVCDGKLSILSV